MCVATDALEEYLYIPVLDFTFEFNKTAMKKRAWVRFSIVRLFFSKSFSSTDCPLPPLRRVF